MEYATKWRQLKWVNVDINSKVAAFIAFRGNLNLIKYNEIKPLWKFNALSKSYKCSNFTININIYPF